MYNFFINDLKSQEKLKQISIGRRVESAQTGVDFMNLHFAGKVFGQTFFKNNGQNSIHKNKTQSFKLKLGTQFSGLFALKW
jgi:hypothetical protein